MKYATFKSSVDSEGQMMCLSKGHTIPGRENQQGEEHGGRPRRADGTERALERTFKKKLHYSDRTAHCHEEAYKRTTGCLLWACFSPAWNGKGIYGPDSDIYEGLAPCRLVGLVWQHQNFREPQTCPDPDALNHKNNYINKSLLTCQRPQTSTCKIFS